MLLRRTPLVLLTLLLCAAFAAAGQRAAAISVSSVAVSPAVVPVPLATNRQTAVLITASVSGVAVGTTVPCTITLYQEPSNTVLAVSPSVNTSPAPVSGTTSVSVQMLIPGGTAAGAAQATANCAGFSGFAPFRITSLVGVSVAPLRVPAGGTAGVAVTIAAAGALPATPCTLLVTDPAGASPPLIAQTVSVGGGNLTTPATALVNLALPQTAPLGTANASVSCTITGVPGSPGDSADFTVIDPSVVTVVAMTTQAVAGGNVSVTSVTLPGFVCVALLNPAVGGRITSPAAPADGNGTAVNMLSLPAGIQAGQASLTVTCSDPTNAANSATSSPQALVIAATSPTAPAGCTGSTGAGAVLGSKPVANAGGPYTGSAGQPLQLSGAGSVPSTGAVLTTCVWDFGDGSGGTELTPTHVYTTPGVYTVVETISDSSGQTAVASTSASIGAFVPQCSQPSITGSAALAPCVTGGACTSTSLPGSCLSPCATLASAFLAGGGCPQPHIDVQASAGGPYAGQAGQSIAFQASAMASGTRRLCAGDATLGVGGPYCNLAPAVDLPNPVTYVWDFGDGSPGSGVSATHVYCAAGNYRVSVTVQFDDGSIATGTTQAVVGQGTASAAPACS